MLCVTLIESDMAIVKFDNKLLAEEPGIKDFVCSMSSKPVLCVTSRQDVIDGAEAYLIESHEIPAIGELDVYFTEKYESYPLVDGYKVFPGLYKDKYVCYWKVWE